MSNVKKVWITPEAEKIIVYCARVSSPANQFNDNIAGLLRHCIKEGHWSIYTMANICLEVNTTRDISAQIIRHTSFHFQEFCIAKDSRISIIYPSGKKRRRTIEWMYKTQNDTRTDYKVRVFNEALKEFQYVAVKEVFDTGVKEVYELILDGGRKIKSTLEHKFMSRKGFIPLGSLNKGDAIAVNGVVAYQDKEWLQQSKAFNIDNGKGVQGIADDAGCSYHTIRKWLKRLDLRFTKKEVALYTEAWNKGLGATLQPFYGKLHSDETRTKMKASAIAGIQSNLYKTGSYRGYRQEVWDFQHKYKNRLLKEFGNRCNVCTSSDRLEIDHIIAVSQAPEKALDYNNLQVLCYECHTNKSIKERKETLKWRVIQEIRYVGQEQTYDIEVDHVSHNYVANGIVTHNSQRYAKVTELVRSSPRRQDVKNRQNSIDDLPQETLDWWSRTENELYLKATNMYETALQKGVAKECARRILPMASATRVYINGTVRSWIHYLAQRCHGATQLEHREIANEIKEIFIKELPVISTALGYIEEDK